MLKIKITTLKRDTIEFYLNEDITLFEFCNEINKIKDNELIIIGDNAAVRKDQIYLIEVIK